MYLSIALFVNSSFLQLRTEVNVCKSFFFPRQYVFLVCWNFVSNLFCFQKFVCSSWFEVCVEFMFSFEFVWSTNNTNPFHLHAVGPYVCGYCVLMNNIVHSFSTTHPSLNPTPPHLSFFFYLHWPPNASPFKFSLVFPLPPSRSWGLVVCICILCLLPCLTIVKVVRCSFTDVSRTPTRVSEINYLTWLDSIRP